MSRSNRKGERLSNEEVLATLKANKWNQRRAARVLNMSDSTMCRLVRELRDAGVHIPSYAPAQPVGAPTVEEVEKLNAIIEQEGEP